MLGDIVHNEEVVRQVRGSGIRKTASLKNGSGKALSSAPTAIRRTLAKAEGMRLDYRRTHLPDGERDSTHCPPVEQKDYRIIIIGYAARRSALHNGAAKGQGLCS
jgi:hypothetical protein